MMGKIGNSDCTSSHIIFRQAIIRQTDQQTFQQRTDRPEEYKQVTDRPSDMY